MTDEEITCPVCSDHSQEDATTSEGIVLTGVKAIVNGDTETIELLQSTLTLFDAHTAISILADIFIDIAEIFSADVNAILDHFRKQLNLGQVNE